MFVPLRYCSGATGAWKAVSCISLGVPVINPAREEFTEVSKHVVSDAEQEVYVRRSADALHDNKSFYVGRQDAL